jgi:uncharacterized protein YjbJ (UPF0337 family)
MVTTDAVKQKVKGKLNQVKGTINQERGQTIKGSIQKMKGKIQEDIADTKLNMQKEKVQEEV